ncbi:MAG TPA: Nif3-like dinuclear metal center hexameric protein [Phycisphaerae bacterium]|nr:Nif3-like dinuclear metal center hexameric protein [Phycisphaerae bacterium]
MTTISDILAAVDRLAPFRLAEEWDNVGLLLGDAAWPVRRVLVSLDVTETVCDEAERLEADCLLAHHPFLFKDVSRVTAETRAGRFALRLAAGRRAVIAAHTNLDAAQGGLCDLLAERAGLTDLEPLHAEPLERTYKVVVFVPAGDLESVRLAAFDAGAGRIGAYTECSFATEGEGTFFAGEGTSPAVGPASAEATAGRARGGRSVVPEHRLEVLAAEIRVGAVVAAIGRAHSYETPAIDVYPLKDLPGEAGPVVENISHYRAGLGRVGRLKKPKTAGQLADDIKRVLGLSCVQVAGDGSARVERVAVNTGSGSGLVEAVRAAGCQAYLAGELKYHEAQALAAEGIAVILGGHYETERVPLEDWTPRLAEAVDVEVILSKNETGATGVQ